MRIGHGYDAHQFETGRPLVLGGVTIPFDRGLAAHSDGDAIIHALCDALLGAAGRGDIGSYFPDTDPALKNVDSRVLLKRVTQILTELGYSLVNADITVLAQCPRLAPHIEAMRANLARDLNADPAVIGIKATTTERMGFVGREEGIAVHAVVLIENSR